MYDALVSADVIAQDPDRVARGLVALLGLPVPRENAYLEPEGEGYRAVWLRTQRSLGVAPTRIEVIGPRPATGPHEYVAERIAAQCERPVRTHATVLAGDVDRLLAHVRSAGVPHRVTPPGEELPFPRLWIGVTEQSPHLYDPASDCHLWMEVIPTEFSGIPAPSGLPAEGPGVHRIRSRRFLVPNLSAAVESLERNLALRPDVLPGAGDEAATYSFRNPQSARIELVSPRVAGPELELLKRWGPGPSTVVLEVGDLAYMEELATRAGVRCTQSEHSDGTFGLRIPTSATAGVPFELVPADPIPCADNQRETGAVHGPA